MICYRLDYRWEHCFLWRVLSLWITSHGKKCPRKTRGTWSRIWESILGTVLILFKIWSSNIKSILISIFIKIIHYILIPTRECINIIIEIHISPIDNKIIRSILSSFDIICHHNTVSLFFRNLINSFDIILYLVGKFLSRKLRHNWWITNIDMLSI